MGFLYYGKSSAGLCVVNIEDAGKHINRIIFHGEKDFV